MPDCFLSVAEGSADRLRLPHSSNDTNRLAILDSDGPFFRINLNKGLSASWHSGPSLGSSAAERVGADRKRDHYADNHLLDER